MRRSFRKAKNCTHIHDLAEKIHKLIEETPEHTDIHEHSQIIGNSTELVCSEEEKKTLANHTTKFEQHIETIDKRIQTIQLQLQALTGTTASPETISQAEAELGTTDIGAPCTADAECESNNCDIGGTNQCTATAFGAPCAANVECQSYNCDIGGSYLCLAAAIGANCTENADCDSGNCDTAATPSVCIDTDITSAPDSTTVDTTGDPTGDTTDPTGDTGT